MRWRRWAGAWSLSLSLIALGASGSPAAVQASESKQQLELPAGNAADVLDRFVRMTKFEVVYAAQTVRGIRTKPVFGRMTPRAALDVMLAGTGLEVVATPGGGAAIRPINAIGEQAAGGKAYDEIVVTGTRLGEEFAGASPVQKIDRDKAAASGLLETAEVLRTQPQVSGPRSQLRYSEGQNFGGSRGGEGPGTQTIALRGLAPSETLVLVNGRRVAAAGVEGVPRSADLSLIPSGLVQDIEILTDAASPVYGTDAIAGIVNIKLRQDFDTTTLYGSLSKPQNAGGEIGLVSLTTGKTFDRGFIGFGAEYRRTEGLKLRNVHGAGPLCPANYDRRQDGSYSEIDLLAAALPGSSASPCRRSLNTISGVFRLSSGEIYYATPGRSNIGVPGYSLPSVSGGSAALAPPRFAFRQFDSNQNGRIDPTMFDPVDGSVLSGGDDAFPDPDGDGRAGVDPQAPAYDLWRDRNSADTTIISPLRQINLFAYGQYDLQALGSATAYFEASFNERRTKQRSIGGTLNAITGGTDLVVPYTNPTNPCGIETQGCYNGFYNDVAVADLLPFVRIDGDGDTVRTRIRQYRLVGGLRGDLAFLDGLGGEGLGFAGWRYDVSVNAGRSDGQSRRPVILKDRLGLSLRTTVRDPATGRLVCGEDLNGDGLPDDPSSCVPVNLFTPEAMIGHRLTAAENAYLFGELSYRTKVDLLQVSATISGKAIRLPAGSVSWVLGAEFRRDGIDASANDVGRRQNVASSGAFIDPGAKGNRTIKELFGEIGIPILDHKPLINSLNASVAGRITDEQFSGTNGTWSARGRYEPFKWLALRSTYGTSFRSPNAYELFTQPFASAFPLTSYDPCVVPFEAQTEGAYDPIKDRRTANTLSRCRAAGVNPTSLGLGFPNVPDAQVERGSALDDLKPERSIALTAGAVVTLNAQTSPIVRWPGDLKVNLAATYYKIRVRDEIQIGDLNDVLNGCYVREGSSLYCRRITRGSDGNITFLREGFINGTSRKTEGMDFNAVVTKGLRVGKQKVDLDLELAGNYEFSVLSDIGTLTEFSGTLGYPKLKMNGTAQVRAGRVTTTWFTNFIGPSAYFTQFAIPADNYPSCPIVTGTTCTPVQRLSPYFLHNASIAYRGHGWGASFGMNNLFDTRPPRLSTFVVTGSPLNTFYNGAYDIFGRTYTLQLRKDF